MLRLTAGLLFLALALGSTVATVRAGEDARPFLGSLAGIEQHVGDCAHDSQADHICVHTLSGTVIATYLGQGSYTGEITHLHKQGNPCATGTGWIDLRAANGDVIHTTVSGTVCESGQVGVHTMTYTLTVTGGTGRFDDATGMITATGTITELGNGLHATSATLSGTLGY